MVTYNKEVASESTIHTNMGDIPIEDYRDIKAMQYGFEDYQDMKSKGFTFE